ncbi:general odorant-binding protein 1-like [Anticarsia gemmatalis]|uniref:general odorant-binding protein 1-like n=1 Tax=Anticarsia gemmatalis TaxID=129554 RepID=UPI003F76DFEA
MRATTVCLALAVLVMCMRRTEPSKDVMRYINSGFVKVLEVCKNELNMSDSVLADLYHFWKLQYNLLNRDTGCIIICMSKKLDLIDSDGLLHHGNAHDFAVKHGADDTMAASLVKIIHECEKQHESIPDECDRVLEVAKCFRTGIHNLDWSPKVEYIVEEVLTEIAH